MDSTTSRQFALCPKPANGRLNGIKTKATTSKEQKKKFLLTVVGAAHHAEKVVVKAKRKQKQFNNVKKKRETLKAETKTSKHKRGGCCSRHQVVLRNLALGRDELDVDATLLQLAGIAQLLVLGAENVREAPVLGHDNDLAAGELHLGAAESLQRLWNVTLLRAHRQENLANANTSAGSVGL
ncbi:large subunit ribosomal protein L10e, partial [Trypanosoma rangeli]